MCFVMILLLTSIFDTGRSGSGASRCGERFRRRGREEILHVLPVGVLRLVLPGKGSRLSVTLHARQITTDYQGGQLRSQFRFLVTALSSLSFRIGYPKRGSRECTGAKDWPFNSALGLTKPFLKSCHCSLSLLKVALALGIRVFDSCSSKNKSRMANSQEKYIYIYCSWRLSLQTYR